MKLSIRPPFGRQTTVDASAGNQSDPEVVSESVVAGGKSTDQIPMSETSTSTDARVRPDGNAQPGVMKAEAITLTWTKTSVAATLFSVWVYYLVGGFKGNIFATLTPFATSDFASHSLIPVIGIVSSALTAASYVPIAKMLDLWGRAEGVLLMAGLATLGTIMLAASKNLPTYCAATVFQSVGQNGAIYALEIVAVDSTSLKNRGLAFAFTSSPYMITAFAGSKAAEGFLYNVNWRWGYGAFAIITPVIVMPLYAIMRMNLNRAKKQGLLPEKRESSGRTFMQTVKYVLVEFDLPGVFLLASGVVVFLLPFSLASTAPSGWSTGYIIAMIVVGIVLLALFACYQNFWAPSPFLPWRFLTDRTIVGSCLINATYQVSYYCWNNYFTSFLQVVYNLSPAEAGYVNSTFQVVSGVLLFIVGWGIRRTGRFRWLFYAAVPLYVFALGLMIHFRQPNGNIGYIIMCEIFISIGGAVFILVCQLTVLAAVDHQHISTALSVLFVSGSIGGAIGSTISGAIWTNTFLGALYNYLPESFHADVPTIYVDLVTQLSYPVGSEGRHGIQLAYGYAQTRMLAAGTAIMSLCFVWMFFLKDVDVRKMQQTKGTVF